jgi:PAS domain S-box-containing protein
MTLDTSFVSTPGSHASVPTTPSNFKVCPETIRWLGDHIPVPIALLDQNLKCTYANPSWYTCWPDWPILPEQTLPIHQLPQSWQININQGFLGIQSTTNPYPFERDSNGDPCVVQWRIVPLLHPDRGNEIMILQIGGRSGFDIDAEHSSEQKLPQSQRTQQQLEAILEHIPGLIHIKDLQGNFLNVSGVEQYGCGDHDADIVGKTSADLFPKDVANDFKKMDQQVLQTRLPLTAENTVPHPDGSLQVYRTIKFPLIDQDGTLYAIGGISSNITAEISLAESEVKYRQLVEQIDDVIFSATVDGICNYISPKCQTIVGYTPADFLGRSYELFIHPEDWQRCKSFLKASLIQGEAMRGLELRIKQKDGGWRWISCNNSPTKDSLGNTIGFQGIATDIHECKLAAAKHLEVEAALHQSEKLLKSLTENVPGMLFQINTTPDGAFQYTYVSSGCRELYGLEPAAILQDSQLVLDAVHPEDRASIFEAIARAVNNPRVCWQWKGRLLLQPSQIKWVQSFAKPELQPNSEVLWHGFTFDISEQQANQQKQEEVEAALQRSDARLSTLISTAPVILFAFDREGQFTLSEGKGLETLGLRPGEVVGESIFDVFRDHSEIVENTKRAIAGEITGFVTLLEGRYYETFFNPVYDEFGHITEIIAASVDMTEQKQAELERQQALITEERNRMAREIHDTLAQALTGIFIQLGAASRLLSQDPATAQQHIEHARIVARSGVAEARRSVEALRSQLLEEGDLYKALSQLVRQLSTLTDAEVSLILPENLYRFPADIENNLLRIVQEAMTNCIRHSLANTITVELDYLLETCRLQIRDDGQGFEIDDKTIQHGYGLLGMQERSVCIGAALEIQSVIGEGTAITVHIPRHYLEEGEQ